MDREQVARAIASTVPQLLTIQVETADPRTSDAVALAVERIADELLRWHDRIATGIDSSRTKPSDLPPSTPIPLSPAPGADPSMTSLRASIERGVIPGAPRTLQLAAAELAGARHSIETTTMQLPEVCDDVASRALTQCDGLAEALRHHEDILLRETSQLRRAGSRTHRVQVFARVVRAERRLARTAMATLAP